MMKGQSVRNGRGMAAEWRDQDHTGAKVSDEGFRGEKRAKNVVQHDGGDAREGAKLGHDG